MPFGTPIHWRVVLLAAFLVPLTMFGQVGTPQPDDHFWDYRFGHPFLPGSVTNTIEAAGGKLYVGGLFTLAFKDGTRKHTLAIWDGTGWSFDAPVVGSPGIDDILVSHDTVFIAGSFTNFDNRGINYVARWTASGWDSLTNQPNARVRILHNRSRLIMGGDFTKVGSITANRLATYGPSGWEPVLTGASGNGVNGSVYSMSLRDSTLFIGGSFTSAGGTTAFNRIASLNLNSSTFSKLGFGFADAVYAIASGPDSVYSTGLLYSTNGVPLNWFAKYGGTGWLQMGSPPVYSFNLQVLSSGRPVTAGAFNLGAVHPHGVMRYESGGWLGVGDAGQGNQSLLSVTGDTIYAGVGISMDDTRDFRSLGRWDGTSWSGLGGPVGIYFEFPNANHVGSLGYLNGTIYAAGSFRQAGDLRDPTLNIGLVKFENGRWSMLNGAPRFGASSGYVYSLASTGSELYAGGYFTGIGATSLRYIGRWDGSAWHPVGGGVNSEVSAMAVSGTNLFVAGNFDSAGTIKANNIARWDGTTWHRLAGGVGVGGSGDINSMIAKGNDLYIAGRFSSVDSGRVAASNVAHWNGSYWTGIPMPPSAPGTPEYITALAVMGNDLYVGFNYYGIANGSGVHRWNGSSWTQVGAPFDGYVQALWSNGSDLYAGGTFTISGTDTLWRVAKWNGSAWQGLGTGIVQSYNGQGQVRTFLGTPEGLLVGGTFLQAGVYYSNNIALWKNYTPATAVGSLSSPILQSPVNNATGVATNAGVQWAAVSGATGYHLQISTDSTFATTLVDDSSLTGTTRNPNTLAANTTYFWRVLAKNASLASWWTGYWKFRTGATSSVDGNAAVPHSFALFQNHPNPFNPSTEIRFDIPVRSTVRLVVYNMLGQKVATLVDGELPAGFHTAAWQGGMASGVYLYRIEAISAESLGGGFVEVRRMVMIK